MNTEQMESENKQETIEESTGDQGFEYVEQEGYNPVFRILFIWGLHLSALIGVNFEMTRKYDFQQFEPTFVLSFIDSVAIILSLIIFTLVIDIAKGCNK